MWTIRVVLLICLVVVVNAQWPCMYNHSQLFGFINSFDQKRLSIVLY